MASDFEAKHVLITGGPAQTGAYLAVTWRSVQTLGDLMAGFPDSAPAVPVTSDLSQPGGVWLGRPLGSIRQRLAKTTSSKPRRWRLLQVESSLACNLRCVMCPWKEISRQAPNRGLLSPETWQAIRPHLLQVHSIDFTGGGEPLLQPLLPEWVAEAKAAGCETGILTNGLLLKGERVKKLLAAGLNWLCVSMDGATADLYEKIRVGSNFDQVCHNLARISDMRVGQVPKTMINFVLMDINVHQVEEIVRLAAALGVDQVNFKQCDVIRGEHGKGHGLFDREETREIRRVNKALDKARRLAKRLGVKTTAAAFTPHERPVCDQDPRSSMFVRFDGRVGPCINLAVGGPTSFLGREATMPVVHYGRLPGEDLEALWESNLCRFFRQRFEQRLKAYDDALLKTLIGGGGGSRERAVESAVQAMPAAPKGCRVCHYLYGI